MALKHSTAPVPSLRARNPAIPTALEEFLKKNLAKPPQDRYQSTQDLCEDLRSLQNALRFGKPVTLKHLNSPVKTQTSAGPLKPQKEAPLEELKVAPKMSALRQPKTKRGTKLDNDRISKILATSVYTGLVILVLMIGGWIYFNLSKPRLIRVPNLVGLNLNEANLRLQEMHLGLKISRHEPSEHYPEGAIIDVNPAPGQDVRENAYVFVTVSSGSRFVEVPDVRGLSVGEAKSILGTVSLSVEDPGRPVRSVNVEPGKIAAQIPEPRRKVERHSKVRVQVSGGPDVSGPTYTQTGERHSYTIRIKMPIVNSKTLLRVDMTDERGTRTVYEQLHSSSDVIECRAEGYGREVIFRIFGDGELLEQVQKTIQGTNQGTRQETKAADVSQTTGQTVGSYGAQP
jgi:serine/threonine-protein kinase